MIDWKILIGKRVKIFTKVTGILFHGLVISSGNDFIQIRDKFNKIVFIPIDNIAQVEEEA
jgi:hypothetical protein